jgi:cation diffusion facilitator CzcD-associated flavoprotein CzcO
MQAGIGPIVGFEKEPEVGGTWWVNQYPGAACDIPSHLYRCA